jgi:hypothetical protein
MLVAVGCERGKAKLHTMFVEGHAYLVARQAENEATFHISKYDHYDWNQKTGEIVFSSAGVPRVIASFQMVGDVSKRSNTWLWAWANKTTDDHLKVSARVVQALGQREQIDRLTKVQWSGDQIDGWEMTSRNRDPPRLRPGSRRLALCPRCSRRESYPDAPPEPSSLPPNPPSGARRRPASASRR